MAGDYTTAGSGRRKRGSQVEWAAGQNDAAGEMEAEPDLEPEPGYDLPCGSEHDGAEPDHDDEPSLGAVLNHHNQADWAQGSVSDCELVNEDGISRDRDRSGWAAGEETRQEARELVRTAERIRRRTCPTVGHDPDEIQTGNLRLIGGSLVHVVGGGPWLSVH